MAPPPPDTHVSNLSETSFVRMCVGPMYLTMEIFQNFKRYSSLFYSSLKLMMHYPQAICF